MISSLQQVYDYKYQERTRKLVGVSKVGEVMIAKSRAIVLQPYLPISTPPGMDHLSILSATALIKHHRTLKSQSIENHKAQSKISQVPNNVIGERSEGASRGNSSRETSQTNRIELNSAGTSRTEPEVIIILL